MLDRQRNPLPPTAATPAARPCLGLPKRPHLSAALPPDPLPATPNAATPPPTKPLSTQQSDFTAEGAPAPGRVGAGLPPEQPPAPTPDLTVTKEAKDDAA